MELKELLKGEKVKLVAFSDGDLKYLTMWYNNQSFLRYYDYNPSFPKAEAEIKEMIDEIKSSRDKFIFSIYYEDNIIGVCGYENILWNNGTATVYIGIGNESYKGKGLAKEAMRLLIDFGFMELNLHRQQLTVMSFNKVAINLYESLGFIKEGTARDFVFRDNKRYDLYTYGLLRGEWLKDEE